LEITRRNAVVAAKLDIIEGCGDAIPIWHSGGLCPAHMRHGGNHDVSEAQGLAYQHDVQLDRGANRQLPGAEKIDPVELMLRLTRVIGNSSGIPPVLRRRSGRFSVARGYSRCSGSTPMACVGTRRNRRGWLRHRRGARRSAGTCASGCATIAASRVSAAGLASHNSNAVAGFVALIWPSGTPLHCRWQRPNNLNCQTDFLEFPRSAPV